MSMILIYMHALVHTTIIFRMCKNVQIHQDNILDQEDLEQLLVTTVDKPFRIITISKSIVWFTPNTWHN